jgi:hypothetical protein
MKYSRLLRSGQASPPHESGKGEFWLILQDLMLELHQAGWRAYAWISCSSRGNTSGQIAYSYSQNTFQTAEIMVTEFWYGGTIRRFVRCRMNPIRFARREGGTFHSAKVSSAASDARRSLQKKQAITEWKSWDVQRGEVCRLEANNIVDAGDEKATNLSQPPSSHWTGKRRLGLNAVQGYIAVLWYGRLDATWEGENRSRGMSCSVCPVIITIEAAVFLGNESRTRDNGS